MATVVAAFIGLGGLLVASWLVRRDERQRWELAERRHLYARFLSAFMTLEYATQRSFQADDYGRRSLELATAWAEMLLAADPDVERIATDLVAVTSKLGDPNSAQRVQELRTGFIQKSRLALGFKDLPARW